MLRKGANVRETKDYKDNRCGNQINSDLQENSICKSKWGGYGNIYVKKNEQALLLQFYYANILKYIQ